MANSFSAAQYRKKALLCQGLLRAESFGRGKRAVQKCIEQLGYVQIDTISVVERAHHHVIWSRVPTYQPRMLNELVRDSKVFEYWFHAAAYLPMSQYRYVLPRMHAIKSGEKHWFTNTDRRLMKKILQRIRHEGPLLARDFTDKSNGQNGWWEWKPAKQALEQLFMEGDLMVVERRGFQKVYDLTERALPASVNTKVPDTSEQARYFIDTAIRSYGFATLKSFTYLRKGNTIRESVKEQLYGMLNDNALVEAELPCGTPVYCDPLLITRKRPQHRVVILSPFDNCVIQRERCRRTFEFDYQIECYVPAPKRKFGYFCLPLLYSDRLVGRIDCKADRKTGVLHVKSVHIEVIVDDAFYSQLAIALQHFMAFNNATELSLECASKIKKQIVAYL
jgi:uncharacterized protein YcaQ